MPAQFDVYAPSDGPLVVLIQSDILDLMPTRVAMPLLDPQYAPMAFRNLNPVLTIEGAEYILAPQLAATFTISELGAYVSEVSDQRDLIIRAIDALLGGI